MLKRAALAAAALALGIGVYAAPSAHAMRCLDPECTPHPSPEYSWTTDAPMPGGGPYVTWTITIVNTPAGTQIKTCSYTSPSGGQVSAPCP